jgi:hypothetical protein
MSTVALASIVVGYLCALALQCALWFAAYKAGLLVTAALLALAAMVLAGLGVWLMFEAEAASAKQSLEELATKTHNYFAFATK